MCPRCQAAAARATRAHAEPGAPAPCHRGAQERPADERTDRRTPAAPCMTGACGSPEAGAPAPPGTDLFTVASRATFALVSGVERIPSPPNVPLERAIPPETPPPRAV